MPRAFTPEERARVRAALRATARAALVAAQCRHLSIDTMVRAAGISKGAFYLFYPNKEAVLVELMSEAEAALRETLRAVASTGPAEGRVLRLLWAMYDGVADTPILRTLGDPLELAWLSRALPEGALAAARADDDVFAAELLALLRVDGTVEVDADVFAGVGPALLAMALQAELIGPARHRAVVAVFIEGLAARMCHAMMPPR